MNKQRKELLDKINKKLIITGTSKSYEDRETLTAYLGIVPFENMMDEYDDYEDKKYIYKQEMEKDIV